MGERMKMMPVLCGVLLSALFVPGHNVYASPDSQTERGRYLVAFGACNDCHTPGWRESEGRLPVSKWMTGSSLGMRGPWGTSYPANVRLWFSQIREADWLFSIRTRAGHPPMHWHDLRFLNQSDQRAIFRFIRSLGPAGKPAPASLGPNQEPHTPYIWIVPHN